MVCIAGFDVNIVESNGKGAIVFWDSESNRIVYENTCEMSCTEMYIPGQLAKRELPFFIELHKHFPILPDYIIVDGNGRFHPDKNGLACEISQFLNERVPVIGVAKNLYKFPGIKIENSFIHYQNEIVAYQLLSGFAIKPVYVSIGGGLTLNKAIEIVKSCSIYRIPEPIRFADKLSRSRSL